jgi:predicted nicotinamide N-methyase
MTSGKTVNEHPIDQQQSSKEELEHQNDDDDDNDENDEYLQLVNFQSIRTPSGLETGITVQWPGLSQLNLSTLLEQDDLAPLFAGAQWAGTRVWHAAICMVKYLFEHRQDQQQQLFTSNSTLLELGCGLGVPGMICHQLWNCRTYLTDQPSIMSQLQRNLKHNFPETNVTSIHARALTWSRTALQELIQQEELLTKNNNKQGFDVVINCDCVYEPLYGDSWKALADVLDEVLRMSPHCLVYTSVERRNADAVDKFLQRLEGQSCHHVSRVKLLWTDPKFKIEIYQAIGCFDE